MKKLITLLLLCVMMVLPLAANGQTEARADLPDAQALSLDDTTPGWKAETSPVSFDWYLNFSWFRGVWGEDMVSRYITEKTGVNVNFIIPAGNEADKLNTMIASGKLPDLITLGWWEPQVQEMIAGGLVYPLDGLAEKYDPWFNSVASPERLGWYTKEDGHVYGYPNASYSPSDYAKGDLPSNQTFLVRKDMWEAIGSPSMRTPQEFLAALSKAKMAFPKVNNQELIPLGLHEFTETGNYSLEDYIMNFLAIPMEKNGKYYDRYSDEEYKTWLKTIRTASERGLISSDVFLDSRSQMEEKIAQGRYFAMIYQRSDMNDAQLARYTEDPDSIYIAIDGPANSSMDDPKLAGQGLSGWTITMISSQTKNPDRAIRFMSYLMSEEGQKDTFLGIEGETWEMQDGKEQFLPEVMDVLSSDRGSFDRTYGGSNKYWMLMDNPMKAQWESAPKTPLKEMELWTYPYSVSYAEFDNIDPLPFEEEGIIASKLSTLFGKALPALINADSEAEFDRLWDELQEARKKGGLDKLIEYKQVKIDENKTKLGL
jgi:putative aldouronate transport system substrate-binding protein